MAVPKSGTGSSRGVGGWLYEVLCKLSTVGLLGAVAISLLRFTNVEQSLLFGLVPIAPAVALGFLVLYGLLRDAVLFVLTLVMAVVIAGLWLPGTTIPRRGCTIESEVAVESLVVMSHNLLIGNNEIDAVTEQIEMVAPGVLLLQEAGVDFTTELLSRIEADYPHVIWERGQVIASRWPLSDANVVSLVGTASKPLILATVEWPGSSFRIANFHANPPFSSELRASQRVQFTELQNAEAFGDIELLMGDFNAPSSDKRYRELRSGFTDAHRSAGCGLGTTWSALGTGPGILSIDHALTRGRVSPMSFEIFDYAGSDHKAIAVRIIRTNG